MTRKPHDAIFKAAFEHPDHAAAFLRGVLPSALVQAIAWSTITREGGSFIDVELADRHSDLLFSVDLDQAHGGRAFLYLLLEHQSSSDPDMPLRMLIYLVRIWERHRKQHAGPLPTILPVVVSHAPGGWTAPRSFHALFEPHPASIPELAQFVPDFTMLVEDLVYVTNEDLKARALAAFPKLALWLLRDARDAEQLLVNLATWGQALSEALRTPHGMESVSVLLRYIALVSHDLNLAEFRARLHEQAPDVEEAAMTIAEQMHAEGLAKGQLQGQIQGQLSALRKLLTLKFGELPPTCEARMANASSVELDAWIERVLEAATLDAVFVEA